MVKNNGKDRIVLAKSFDTDWEAHMAHDILTDNGVKCVLDNEIMAGTIPIGLNTIGGVRLMVFSHDLERARELLAGISYMSDADASD